MERVFAFAYLGGVLWLLSWELAALVSRRAYTLSHIWWQVEGSGWTAARYFTLMVLLFLTAHLALGWWK